jgi:hypothetical protein
MRPTSNRRVGDCERRCRELSLGQDDTKDLMFRFLFRLMAMFALAIAVIMAVLDATRTLASSELVLTPLNTSWMNVSPDTFAAVQSFFTEKAHPLVWDLGAMLILNQPGFAVFAGLAFLLYAIGRKPRRRPGRFAAEIQ